MRRLLSLFTPLVLLLTSILAVVAASSAPIAAADTTAASVPFTCTATNVPFVGTTTVTQSLAFHTDAPATVSPGTTFDVVVHSDPITIPSSQSASGVSATVNYAANAVVHIPVPANSTYVNAALTSSGTNLNSTPTLTYASGMLTMTIPGPFNGGTTITPPDVTATLTASTTKGAVIAPAIDNSDTGYTLDTNITVLGSTATLHVSCNPDDPEAPLSSTMVVGPDITAPVISMSAPTNGNNYAQNSSVTVSYSCVDPNVVGEVNSGLATCVGSLPNGASLDTSSAGAHTFSVTSTDVAGNSSSSSITYNVIVPVGDKTPPTISITSPTQGATYTKGQVVAAGYTCADDQASGTCVGTVGNGANIDTAASGPHTFTVNAVDASGNKNSQTVSYYVLVGGGSVQSNNACPTLSGVSGSTNISSSPGTKACVRSTAAVANGGTLTPGSTLTLDYQLYHPTGVGGWNGGMNVLNWTLNLPTNTTLVGSPIVNETGINGENHAGAYSCSGGTGTPTVATTATQVQITNYDANSYTGGIADVGCTSGDGVLVHVQFTVQVNPGATGTVTVKGFPGITGTDPTTVTTNVTSDPITDAQVGIAYHIADMVPPTVSITSPVHGSAVDLNTSLNAGFTCADETSLASCTAKIDGTTVANGAALPTNNPGSHQLAVTAVDADGNTTIGYSTYYVNPPDLTITGCTAVEAQNCTFTLTLSQAAGVATSVDYATADGTAVAGTRYTAKSGTVTFAAGETSKTVVVSTIGNFGQWPNQDFYLNLSNPVKVNLLTYSATGTVTDKSGLPYVIAGLGTVHRSSAAGGTVHIPVNIQDQFGQNVANGYAVSVTYATADFQGHAPLDYTPTSGTLTFPAGSTATQYVDVQIPSTTYASDPKAMLIFLQDPVNAQLGGFGPGLGVGGIYDDNPPVQIAISDTSVNVKSGGTATLKFVMPLTNVSDQVLALQFATSDGTAVAGTDYTAASNTMLIGAGATAPRQIWVTVKGAAPVGSTLTFTMTLSSPSGPLQITNSTATGTIHVVS